MLRTIRVRSRPGLKRGVALRRSDVEGGEILEAERRFGYGFFCDWWITPALVNACPVGAGQAFFFLGRHGQVLLFGPGLCLPLGLRRFLSPCVMALKAALRGWKFCTESCIAREMFAKNQSLKGSSTQSIITWRQAHVVAITLISRGVRCRTQDCLAIVAQPQMKPKIFALMFLNPFGNRFSKHGAQLRRFGTAQQLTFGIEDVRIRKTRALW